MSAPKLTDDERAELSRNLNLALNGTHDRGGDRLQQLLDELERAVIVVALTAGDVTPSDESGRV